MKTGYLCNINVIGKCKDNLLKNMKCMQVLGLDFNLKNELYQ